EDLGRRADVAIKRLRLAQAASALREAAAWSRRLGQAKELAARYPSGPPCARVADKAQAEEVAAALRMYDERPDVNALSGTSAADLRLWIQALPAMPDGDLTPHAGVVTARQRHQRAQQAVELHEQARPPEPVLPPP